VQASEGHFGSGDHVQVFFVVLVQVIGELGKLPGSPHGFRIHHEGRLDLQVPVLLRVKVKHEGQQGPFKPSPQPFQDREAALGQGCPLLEIQNAQGLAEIPVRLGLEGKLLRLPAAPDFRVVVLVLPTGTES